jgi:hypothetical protein
MKGSVEGCGKQGSTKRLAPCIYQGLSKWMFYDWKVADDVPGGL